MGVLNASANGGGLLGGLFGGGMNQYAYGATQAVLAEKDAKIARLESEKYADHVGIDVYAQTRRENQDLSDRLLGNWIKPLSEEAAANRERIAVLETEVKNDREKAMLREHIVTDKIDSVAMTASHGIANVGAGLAALKATVDSVMCHKICKDAICPPVMERWNAWVSPENVTAPATQPITGVVNAI